MVRCTCHYPSSAFQEKFVSQYNSIHRDYKSGTKILIRASIDTHRGNNDLKCKIYDEDEKIVLERSVIDEKVLRIIASIPG